MTNKGDHGANGDLGSVFGAVYDGRMWGPSPDGDRAYFSGTGSREPDLILPYLYSVRGFLLGFGMVAGRKPEVVDLGCGDFTVGSRLVETCARYVACDVVAPLIEENRRRFSHSNVEFLVLDATRQKLPRADVVLIRQVLQHLSNEQISQVLARLPGRFGYAVVTEHLPAEPDFTPNLDMPTGPGTRLVQASGVVPTAPPFSLGVEDTAVLCNPSYHGSKVRTWLYKLRTAGSP